MTAAEHVAIAHRADRELEIVHDANASPRRREVAQAAYDVIRDEMVELNDRDPLVVTGHAAIDMRAGLLRAAADAIEQANADFRKAFNAP